MKRGFSQLNQQLRYFVVHFSQKKLLTNKVWQPVIVNILRNFKILSAFELKGRTITRDYAFSIERLPAGKRQ